jgi:hypothetical protein
MCTRVTDLMFVDFKMHILYLLEYLFVCLNTEQIITVS